MAQKYTVYKLKNVKGKKNEYILDDSQRLKYICNSLSAGYHELQEYWDDCLGDLYGIIVKSTSWLPMRRTTECSMYPMIKW